MANVKIGAIPFTNGPGLRVYSTPQDRPWYGSGYCHVCGGSPFPARVRFWDCDDGWKSGVLCVGCATECAERGPRCEDYATVVARADKARHMDMVAFLSAGDDDAAHTDSEDL